MKNIVITTLFLFASIALFANDTDTTKSAQPLPSVTVKNINGQNVDISSYGTNGKITVISFWATWCKPCVKELRNINELLEDWEDNYNVELVAISM
ncbi:MAG: cytochrome c biogenesis protein CcmG/thiol:disulfide interchange protein DsbE, partial [Bacteroidia bacterium]